MTGIELSLADARRLALHGQGLIDWRPAAGKAGVMQVIDRLGYVQIDTIHIVERAHNHTIWVRCPNYHPTMLDALHSQDRRVFEYWAPQASYVPMSDYRYYIGTMRGYAASKRVREWLAGNRELADHIVARIREEGALAASDFQTPEQHRGKSWWDWKPAKRGLDTLFSTGELMVSGRRNFQRLYDLPERVLPDDVDTREPDPVERRLYLARRHLRAHGVLSPLRYRPTQVRNQYREVLGSLAEAGEAVRAEVEGLDGVEHYVSAAALEGLHDVPHPHRLHILSPFDSVINVRERVERLFGFYFRIECYLPAPKRVYGYFCLPVLWGDRFVGRLDCKADRKPGTLIVRGAIFEEGIQPEETLLAALAERLLAYARFNGCHEIVFERVEPEAFATPMAHHVETSRIHDGGTA